MAAETTAPGCRGSDVLSALDGLGGGSAEGVVGGDDHEGEDALGDDVHDGVGHNLRAGRATPLLVSKLPRESNGPNGVWSMAPA